MDKERYSNIAVYVSLVFKIIGIFLGIATIFMLIWKVFGHSPTSDSVLMFSVALLGTIVVSNMAITVNMAGKFGGFQHKMGKMESDINYIKSEVKDLKKYYYFMTKDIREIKNHLKMNS